MRTYTIKDTLVGGLRLAVFEDGIEVCGACSPSSSEDDWDWLEEIAACQGAVPALTIEGGADAKSTP